MKKNRLSVTALVLGALTLGFTVSAQVVRPYRNASVWEVAFIQVKPGMDSAYKEYLAGAWKSEQEALKKDGLILSYKVLTTEAHDADDWNMMLMTEYKDLATLEASEAKADAIVQRVIGNDETQRQGYRERLAIREVLGSRIAREVVLEPRR